MSRRVLGSSAVSQSVDTIHSLDNGKDDGNLIQSIQCPICLHSMESLGQLNRHLDDEHVEVADAVSEVGVRSWFQKQLTKSAKIAPVAAVGKTLNIVEDFERNEDHEGAQATKVSDALVSRSHWATSSSSGRCSQEGCTQVLKSSRCINCRHCGRMFCGQHTMFQMRLARSATYEPRRGIWCRVCRGCYEARDWYFETAGAMNVLTHDFIAARQRQVDRVHLKSQMIERRMTKLLQGLLTMHSSIAKSFSFFDVVSSSSSSKSVKRRVLEQSVVPWEDEKQIRTCPLCNRAFTLERRKHHCRMCGRCICGDVQTRCSTIIPFQVSIETSLQHSLSESVRLCRDCDKLLIKSTKQNTAGKADLQFDIRYRRLRQYREAIVTLMPRYQKLVSDTSNSNKRNLAEIHRVRKCVTDSLTQIEVLATSIRALPTKVNAQQVLQNAIAKEAKSYLQTQLLTLQTIAGVAQQSNDKQPDCNTFLDVQNMSEQQQLRDEIVILTEQKFLLKEQAEDARRRRRFEDHSSIQASIEEIEKEITLRQQQLVLWSGDA